MTTRIYFATSRNILATSPWNSPKRPHTGPEIRCCTRSGRATGKGREEVLGSTAMLDAIRGIMQEDPRYVIMHPHGFASTVV